MYIPKTLVVVGFVGRIGSGKSTCCRLAKREFGAGMVSVVDPLKELAMSVYGLPYDVVYGNFHVKEQIDPRYGVSVRVLLQRLGDGCRSVLGDDVWVAPTIKRIGEQAAAIHFWDVWGGPVVVAVDSLRLPVEVADLRSLERDAKGLASNVVTRIVKLVPVNRSTASPDSDEHDSEDAVDRIPGSMIDVTIENDHQAGPGALEATIRSWLSEELAGIK